MKLLRRDPDGWPELHDYRRGVCRFCGVSRDEARPGCWESVVKWKTLRNIALLMLAIIAVCIVAQPAQAQSREVRSLLSDLGWHGVGGGVQVHQPTLEFRAPWLAVWERSARGTRYGDWNHVKVLINCAQWSHIPIATLDADGNVDLIADLTGEEPAARWPDPDTVPYRTMTALCALYGYERQAVPVLTPNADGSPYVGGIKQLDKP